MEFQKYNSLENHYRTKFIDKIQMSGLSGGQWVVQEKCDGANFSFWCDGEQVKIAKRSGFIGPVDNFFECWSKIYPKYQQKVLEAFAIHCHTGDVLVLCGELYGPGILNRVDYGPEKGFVCFDAMINGIFEDALKVEEICIDASIPHVPRLGVFDTMEEALNFNEDFDTLMNPQAQEGKRKAEGIVIKPLEPKFLSNGSRIVIKKKAESFSEKKSTKRDHKFKDKTLNAKQEKYLNELLEYSTESRLKSTISKIGTITDKDFGKLMGLFVKDILEDYEKETEVDLKSKLGKEFKGVASYLQKECASLIKRNFVNILDGEY